ncbi:PEGA domain-containing protein [bacterium]|nr:MAG: PEGA domain-containing protein [bacterium]
MKNNILILAWIISMLFVFTFINPSIAGTGDLQIFIEQGFEIYIDDHLVGATNGFDRGLFVEGLEPGPHTLRAEKKGFETVRRRFNITDYEASVISIEPEDIKQMEEQEAATGSFRLRSGPMGAAVYIDDVYRGSTDMTVEKVKMGTHRIRFERDGTALVGDFFLVSDEVLTLKAHFRDRVIIDISAMEKEERKRKTEEAAYYEAVRAGSGNDVDAAILAWLGFLEDYPDGAHAREGRQQLALWEERNKKDLIFMDGEWIAAAAAADKLKDQGEDWVQLDIGISLMDLSVAYVVPSSTAGKAGILTNDVILEVDKKRMKKTVDVQKALKKGKKEKPRLILLQRSGRTVFVEVVY